MSKLFCSSPQLCVLERQMQQPPGYRPRGGGIWIMNEAEWRNRGNYLEIVDCVVSRMQMEHLKRRIEEIFCEAGKAGRHFLQPSELCRSSISSVC